MTSWLSPTSPSPSSAPSDREPPFGWVTSRRVPLPKLSDEHPYRAAFGMLFLPPPLPPPERRDEFLPAPLVRHYLGPIYDMLFRGLDDEQSGRDRRPTARGRARSQTSMRRPPAPHSAPLVRPERIRPPALNLAAHVAPGPAPLVHTAPLPISPSYHSPAYPFAMHPPPFMPHVLGARRMYAPFPASAVEGTFPFHMAPDRDRRFYDPRLNTRYPHPMPNQHHPNPHQNQSQIPVRN
ncbi:unnamed protein product [Cutaneotrichosporon oleaginosum]